MFEQLKRPTIFAHRGSSAHAPENTLASFELALYQGADAIELDVKLSADKQVVVIHDPTVDRTTSGKGSVSMLTLAELCKLDAGSLFKSAFKGEKIPTLADVFDKVGKKIFINIELTNYTTPNDELPVLVTQLISQFNLENHVMFSSFNPLVLKHARQLLPMVPIGLLAYSGIPGLFARSLPGFVVSYEALHPAIEDVSPHLLEKIHSRGRRMHVYTVNDPDDIKRLFSMGVDGIFTDDPVLAQKVRSEVMP